MKVVARKRYYEEDLYSNPGHGWSYTKEQLKDFVISVRKKYKVDKKKGDFWMHKVEAGDFCCEDFKEYGKAQVENSYIESSAKAGLGMFLPFQGWGDTDYIRIDYCPFCGEKIEVVEEE